VTASHRDLEKMVETGGFREDLFFRIAVVRLDLPPLRERTLDIPRLVAHFVEKHGQAGATMTRAAMDLLLAHPFPGNVRELENEVHRALVLSDGEIHPEHLSPSLRARAGEVSLENPLHLRGQIDALERRLIREALALHRGNQSQAAKTLGVSRYGLQKMITRLGLR
jgi:DNA-binding NtrC family response regulator